MNAYVVETLLNVYADIGNSAGGRKRRSKLRLYGRRRDAFGCLEELQIEIADSDWQSLDFQSEIYNLKSAI